MSLTANPPQQHHPCQQPTTPTPILTLEQVTKKFPLRGGLFKQVTDWVQVLNGVSLSLQPGEVFGLVGESGCGKSTLAKLLVKLHPVSSGQICFEGVNIDTLRGQKKKDYFRQVQMVFQDPYAALNPKLKVKTIIGEMVRVQGASKAEEQHQVAQILRDVGLDEQALTKYPHAFSGGQRQRISIARALVVRPRLLIADEPVSALDLFVQSQIIDRLRALKTQYQLTILFISHDLNTVAGFCDRVGVMYLGRLVEIIPANRLFQDGCHPYLKALLDAIPIPDPAHRHRPRTLLTGEVPSPLNLPTGCAFHPRCSLAVKRCLHEYPALSSRGEAHWVACHCA